MARTQRVNLYKEDSSSCAWATDTKYSKESFFNHFHNPHSQDPVHHQDISCSPNAQPLKQAQEKFQTYTLKKNLS